MVFWVLSRQVTSGCRRFLEKNTEGYVFFCSGAGFAKEVFSGHDWEGGYDAMDALTQVWCEVC